ncbi:Glycosyl transferase, group 1 family protein OS=Rhodopirellula maiorica SM1 GN=RMSM_06534 PE=4 SV=1: Glyco_trans_4_4: Glycos_transf_1 [Gemmata massiliana]|uniref:Glycosyl transferase family 1 domain-containing protein n=1 Tax=Gemmata massiliana TaxID=1210884 RepID=A0A6P2DGI5_9BACT|nr:glycosyltransferase [Gemmata massiliana]VTS00044.1 Glycosyl transferase, group 1 family protein OS=Rhodopirellula maiorica SM1 GN=RMSM_06534 PE=4 SV=1: Glyco_trans_4_4: Glycos_transf_1 [Gemmata massiliana]
MDTAGSLIHPPALLPDSPEIARGAEPITGPVILDARVVTGAGGGPEKTILNSPRFLESLGYRMVCAYMHPPGDPGFDVLTRQAAKYRAPLLSIPDRGAWDWRVVTRALAICRRENVTVWHGHDYKTNALGLLLKRLWPMRLVTTVHGWVRHTRRTPLYYRIDQLCLPYYERVICVSDDLLDACLAAGVPAKNCVLLENGIDTAEYSRVQTLADAKATLDLPTDAPVIGAVGRLSPEKGFDVLIRAAHALVAQGHDVRLVIVGEGDERANLERLIRELDLGARVRLAGWQTNVRAYFEAMDVFALSSLREGLPNVVLEAMALGVPVVSTRVNGVPRLIRDGHNGALVDPGDLDGLTAALAGLLRSDSRREQFRAAGRRTVETRYNFATRMQRLKCLYDELLAQ